MLIRNAIIALVATAVLGACGAPARKPAPVTDRAVSEARTSRPAAATPSAAPQPTLPPTPKPALRASDGSRPDTHTVKPGDTLYSIALDYGLDYRELADWNSLENVSVIRVGQQLRLTAPTASATAPLKPRGEQIEARPLDARVAPAKPLAPPVPSGPAASAANTDRLKAGPRAARVPYSDQAWAQANKVEASQAGRAEVKPEPKIEAKPASPKGEAAVAAGDWSWPTSGKIISQFNGNTIKGIDIAGKAGQPVTASAPGRVIFSGIGIRGLGKFVVIKHNNEFISVYAHNSELAVKQDQVVTRGQKIGEMGDTDSDQVKLHFQIRRFGTPIDPLKLLPDRG